MLDVLNFQISDLNLSITLNNTVLRLKWLNISLIEWCSDETEPCLYLTLKMEYLKAFHSNLGLLPGRFPCYDPFGTGEPNKILKLLELDQSLDITKILFSIN